MVNENSDSLNKYRNRGEKTKDKKGNLRIPSPIPFRIPLCNVLHSRCIISGGVDQGVNAFKL